MDQEHHVVYPVDVEMTDVDMDQAEDDVVNIQEVDETKRKLKEMEEEVAALREMQPKTAKEMGLVSEPVNLDNQAAKEEIDSHSVYVGNIQEVYETKSKLKEMDETKRKLKEMEEEVAALRQMQSKRSKEMGVVSEPINLDNQAAKEEIDSRSVYVSNVHYACPPEEVQQHFMSCGTVNRVTILTNKGGQPKGFAYVEFLEVEAVQQAILLNQSELHGRQIKVVPKRTNVTGLKKHPARRYNAFIDYGYVRPYMPRPYHAPYCGYRRAPRYRRPMRYTPYM